MQLLQYPLNNIYSKTHIKTPVIRAFIQQVLYDTRIQEVKRVYKPSIYLPTGIENLDAVLEGGFIFGETIEFYGSSYIDLSKLISHIIASYLISLKQDNVHIYDATGMFEARSMENILRKHHVHPDTLHKIEYTQTFTMKHLSKSLELFGAQLAVSDDIETMNPLIVIDELSYLLSMNDDTQLMNRLIQNIKSLCELGCAVLIKDSLVSSTIPTQYESQWNSVIDTRLNMLNASVLEHEIVVVKSKRIKSPKRCIVNRMN